MAFSPGSTVGALALAFVTLSPNSAEAGWRRGPTVVYAGPRYGWFGYRPYYRPYAITKGYPYGYYPYWRGRYWRGWYYPAGHVPSGEIK
jgi:hypothetical protein